VERGYAAWDPNAEANDNFHARENGYCNSPLISEESFPLPDLSHFKMDSGEVAKNEVVLASQCEEELPQPPQPPPQPPMRPPTPPAALYCPPLMPIAPYVMGQPLVSSPLVNPAVGQPFAPYQPPWPVVQAGSAMKPEAPTFPSQEKTSRADASTHLRFGHDVNLLRPIEIGSHVIHVINADGQGYVTATEIMTLLPKLKLRTRDKSVLAKLIKLNHQEFRFKSALVNPDQHCELFHQAILAAVPGFDEGDSLPQSVALYALADLADIVMLVMKPLDANLAEEARRAAAEFDPEDGYWRTLT